MDEREITDAEAGEFVREMTNRDNGACIGCAFSPRGRCHSQCYGVSDWFWQWRAAREVRDERP